MILDILEMAGEAIEELLDAGDTADIGETSTAVTEGAAVSDIALTGVDFTGTAAPVSSNVQSTLDMLNGLQTDLAEDFAAMDSMSPEELETHISQMEAQTAHLDSQLQAQTTLSEMEQSTRETQDWLSEAKAESFATGGHYTPFENGITLSDSNVPISEAEVTQLGGEMIETDDKYYKKYSDGTYWRTDEHGKWL